MTNAASSALSPPRRGLTVTLRPRSACGRYPLSGRPVRQRLRVPAQQRRRHPRAPACPVVVEAIRRQLPPSADPDALVSTGPGGGNHVAADARTVLSRHGVRRMYQTAVSRADLGHLDLRGPHDFPHTFSTWLEDPGIPARVIDELMGHQRSRHGELDGGSRIGARYRHTTDAMALRVVEVVQERLTIALRVAEATPADRKGAGRVF
jgi:integrase